MNSKITNRDYDGLTQRDLDNLKFLINASKTTIKRWMAVVDEDDINYALELMAMYHLRMCDVEAEKSDLGEAKIELAKIGIFVTNNDI